MLTKIRNKSRACPVVSNKKKFRWTQWKYNREREAVSKIRIDQHLLNERPEPKKPLKGGLNFIKRESQNIRKILTSGYRNFRQI